MQGKVSLSSSHSVSLSLPLTPLPPLSSLVYIKSELIGIKDQYFLFSLDERNMLLCFEQITRTTLAITIFESPNWCAMILDWYDWYSCTLKWHRSVERSSQDCSRGGQGRRLSAALRRCHRRRMAPWSAQKKMFFPPTFFVPVFFCPFKWLIKLNMHLCMSMIGVTCSECFQPSRSPPPGLSSRTDCAVSAPSPSVPLGPSSSALYGLHSCSGLIYSHLRPCALHVFFWWQQRKGFNIIRLLVRNTTAMGAAKLGEEVVEEGNWDSLPRSLACRRRRGDWSICRRTPADGHAAISPGVACDTQTLRTSE